MWDSSLMTDDDIQDQPMKKESSSSSISSEIPSISEPSIISTTPASPLTPSTTISTPPTRRNTSPIAFDESGSVNNSHHHANNKSNLKVQTVNITLDASPARGPHVSRVPGQGQVNHPPLQRARSDSWESEYVHQIPLIISFIIN